MNEKRSLAIACIIVGALLVSGAFFVLLKAPSEEPASGILPTFSNYGQIDKFLGKASQRGGWDKAMTFAENGQAAASRDVKHSTTNIQVEGVDEADSVKTDGEYIYIASWETVSIVKAYPVDEMTNVSRITMREALGLDANYSVWINGIYIVPGSLVVVASVSGPYYYYNYSLLQPWVWRAPEERSVIAVFDLTIIESPALVASVGVSGYPITSRMTAGTIYVIAQHYIWRYQEDLMKPKVWEGNDSSEMTATKVHYDPESKESASFINILALELGGLESNYTSILAGYASTVYVSESAIYLTFQKWASDVVWAMDDTTKSSAPVATSVDSITTTIYKVKFEGLKMLATARGDVPGLLLNQFSLDEKDGNLRVATTFSWSNQRNAVYILDEQLKVTGALEDLAPDERIFSCRFMGDTLYLVTFRQVDPLFVIDLSDPTSPRVVGELKVPGFSSYLHPIDAEHLLGIGMENGSVKLSLFDVSSPDLPTEVDTLILPGWSTSEALWDHKAVLYDPETHTLVLPITTYDNRSWNITRCWNSILFHNVRIYFIVSFNFFNNFSIYSHCLTV